MEPITSIILGGAAGTMCIIYNQKLKKLEEKIKEIQEYSKQDGKDIEMLKIKMKVENRKGPPPPPTYIKPSKRY